MVSVNDRIEYQGRRTSVKDTGWVVPAIKGDRTTRPWVEFWGDMLYGVDILNARLRSLLGMWVT